MTKDVIAAIIERRSVRRFTDEEVPMATVGRILDAACHAPSAGNLQPWEFYVVKNREMREKLAVAALNQEFVATAPVVIVVCALPELSARRYGDRGRYLCHSRHGCGRPEHSPCCPRLRSCHLLGRGF